MSIANDLIEVRQALTPGITDNHVREHGMNCLDRISQEVARLQDDLAYARLSNRDLKNKILLYRVGIFTVTGALMLVLLFICRLVV